ncbi:MAG: hypothetical protein V1726_08225 [Methanobacteriota archaeon]
MQRESVYDRMTNAEREVASVLKEMKIQWAYEQPVFVWDENKRPRVWAPDFYLKNFGIYIEVCGSRTFDYDYRRKILDKNGYQVIFLHLYKETSKWRVYLISYLEKIMNYRYSKLKMTERYMNQRTENHNDI